MPGWKYSDADNPHTCRSVCGPDYDDSACPKSVVAQCNLRVLIFKEGYLTALIACGWKHNCAETPVPTSRRVLIMTATGNISHTKRFEKAGLYFEEDSFKTCSGRVYLKNVIWWMDPPLVPEKE